MTVLRLHSVAIDAGGRRLFSGLSLEVSEGELVALRGPSGIGKTSLLRAVAALEDAAEGQITLDDRDAAEWGVPAYRRRVVYVAQRPALPTLPVAAALRQPFAYRSGAAPFPEQDCDRYLHLLGLDARVHGQRAATLSEGERQRVCLVRALLLRPAFLLLDEPTSALDDAAVLAVEVLLREEATRHGLGALVVTHDRRQAERLCSRSCDLDSPPSRERAP